MGSINLTDQRERDGPVRRPRSVKVVEVRYTPRETPRCDGTVV